MYSSHRIPVAFLDKFTWRLLCDETSTCLVSSSPPLWFHSASLHFCTTKTLLASRKTHDESRLRFGWAVKKWFYFTTCIPSRKEKVDWFRGKKMIFWYLLYSIPRVVRILQILVTVTQIPFLGAALWSPRDHLSWGQGLHLAIQDIQQRCSFPSHLNGLFLEADNPLDFYMFLSAVERIRWKVIN